MIHGPKFWNYLLLITFTAQMEHRQHIYNVTAWHFYCLLNSFTDNVLVCLIYKYIVTCINIVITCQTVEFGRATTVLGITTLCKLLIGQTGCWQCFIKHRHSIFSHNQKWGAWTGYLMLWVSAALVWLPALSNVYLFLSRWQIFCHINFKNHVKKTTKNNQIQKSFRVSLQTV